jgi:hypothetical protein
MSDASRIEVRELSEALARVLVAVEAKFGPSVDLAADAYWTLDPRTAFIPSEQQGSSMTVAQLSDDVREIRESLASSEEPVIWHDLAHIVGVLSRIAALDLP